MGADEGLRYRVFVVLLDEYVGTLPQMRRRTLNAIQQNRTFMLE